MSSRPQASVPLTLAWLFGLAIPVGAALSLAGCGSDGANVADFLAGQGRAQVDSGVPDPGQPQLPTKAQPQAKDAGAVQPEAPVQATPYVGLQPLPPGCTHRTDGSGTTCKTTDTWKVNASSACEQAGLSLGGYSLNTPCGLGSYSNMNFDCCPYQATTPVDPTRCTSSSSCPAGLTCSTTRGECLPCSAAPGSVCPAICYGVCEAAPPPRQCTFDMECKAVDDYCGGCTCRSLLTPGAMMPTCQNPVSCLVAPCQGRVAACVAGTCTTVAAAPTPECTTGMQGGPGSCKDAATWQKYASQDCDQRAQTLSTFTLTAPCGGVSYTTVTYDCCSP